MYSGSYLERSFFVLNSSISNPAETMAKPTTILVLLSTVLYLSTAQDSNVQFKVEGEVYCDSCRAQFMNRLSERMAGATVRLECRDPVEHNLTYSTEGQTDSSGHYSLKVDGDHEDEICEVVLVKSSKADCNEIPKEGWAQSTSRITITANNGIADHIRQASPLGFMAKEPLSQCIELYKELNMLPPEQL